MALRLDVMSANRTILGQDHTEFEVNGNIYEYYNRIACGPQSNLGFELINITPPIDGWMQQLAVSRCGRACPNAAAWNQLIASLTKYQGTY